ncbi:MAG: hypothetical protein GXX96_38315 [Planctomycetaceae bacterium]|nr:hypothetical protein [Planctomycetaceae bacterium]
MSLGCSFFIADRLAAADQSGFPGDSYRCIGGIVPRNASEIHESNWSVGAETMDRDYTVYKNWKQYLGPLGAKHARIQSGWEKTEKEKGIYNWAWLDEIVDDMVAQGVTPWVCICYGNSIYPEGGDTRLNGWPRSEEALAAWDRYVAALVKRYRSRVSEWEIWNEPGVHLMNDAKTDPRENATDYADFFIRTATIVRREQPTARILGLALPKMPLLVDLRTGKVYQGPVKAEPRLKMTFSDVPVYDSPIVLAHLGGLPFAPPDDPPCETATPGDGYRLPKGATIPAPNCGEVGTPIKSDREYGSSIRPNPLGETRPHGGRWIPRISGRGEGRLRIGHLTRSPSKVF